MSHKRKLTAKEIAQAKHRRERASQWLNNQMMFLKNINYSSLRRGYNEVEYEGSKPLAWPRCEITDCKNGICIGMSKSLCYPHGIEFGAFTEEQFEANRKAKFK